MAKKHKQKSGADAQGGQSRADFRYWPHLIVLIIILFFGIIRFRLLDMPLERDEGEYAYAGQLILQGIPPYQLAYNMKLPGTYAAYAVILGLFGQTPAGVHAGLLLANAATTFLVFLLAARLFGAWSGVISAASYALLSTSPTVLGFAGHATHFVALAAVAGIFLLLKAIESKRPWLYFCAGLLVGLAFVMKQPGIFFVFFAGLYFLISEWKPTNDAPADSHKVDWRGLAVRGSMLIVGAVLPFAFTCVVLWRAGAFSKFWFWTFLYAREYASALGPYQGVQVLWGVAPGVIGSAVFVWLFAAVGLSAIGWDSEIRTHSIFLSAFLLFSFLAVCPGFYFRQHYFIVMLPAVSLLAGAAVAATTRKLKQAGKMSLQFLPSLLFVFAGAYPLVAQQDFFFQMDPLTACRAIYGPNPFPEALQIADYLRNHSSPNARIAILGSEPEIYFYARRHSATGYIYVYPLMEVQKYASTMQQEMISQIEAAQPEYIVLVDVQLSWLARPGSDTEILAWSQRYIQERYQLDGIVDILTDTVYRWGADALTYRPTSEFTVKIFKRGAP
ncbi:MAG TPA: glycosyltransferase family 39 protein [Terriglobales bacterium]|nr:glycosyltransferase family 39 protein [Terriglobales bacterium]